jgi:hypothetical protein
MALTNSEIFDKYSSKEAVYIRKLIEYISKIEYEPPSCIEIRLIDEGIIEWDWDL